MNNPEADFLQSIAKKDEDARITSYGSGLSLIETELDFQEIGLEEEVSPIDHSLLRDDATGDISDVSIRVLFGVFGVAAVVNLMTMILGFIPYWLLLFDETRTVAVVVFSVTITLCAVFLGLMTWQRKSHLGIAFFACWIFTRLFMLGALSALVQNIVPIFMDAICFGQSATVVLYTYLRPKFTNVEVVYVRDVTIMISVVSVLVWVLGIYIFIEEHAWLYGIILLVLSAGVCFYNWWTIQFMVTEGRTYSLSRKDREQATIEYYSRVVLKVWNKLIGV